MVHQERLLAIRASHDVLKSGIKKSALKAGGALLPARLMRRLPLHERFQLALNAHQTGQLDVAEEGYRKLLRENPDFADAWHLLGLLYLDGPELNDPDKRCAKRYLDEAVRLNPVWPAYQNSLGNWYYLQGQFDEAIPRYQRAIELDPGYDEPYSNLGWLLHQKGAYAEAETCLRKALALNPDLAAAWNNLGNTLLQRADDPKNTDAQSMLILADALACLQQAQVLQPAYPEALLNSGFAYHRLEDYRSASQCFQTVIQMQPDNAYAVSALALLCQEMGMAEDAELLYHRALSLDPNDAQTRWNLSCHYLQQGMFAEGWALYESRFLNPDVPVQRLDEVYTRWVGAPEPHGCLLVHAEQGFGDTLQFVRLLPQIKSRFEGKVILQVQNGLKTLLQNNTSSLQGGWDEIVERSETLDNQSITDHLPLMSAPAVLGLTLENLPAATPYLVAESDCIARWAKQIKERLNPGSQNASGPRVGLVWSGSSTNRSGRKRSIELSALSPVIEAVQRLGVTWVNLQKMPLTGWETETAAVLKSLQQKPQWVEPGKELNDFNETAGLIEALDWVVTVDTSVAHLAGAMGKPVWLLLPFASDWRWFRNLRFSPWYPGVCIFQQTQPGNWNEVLAQVEQAMTQIVHDSLVG